MIWIHWGTVQLSNLLPIWTWTQPGPKLIWVGLVFLSQVPAVGGGARAMRCSNAKWSRLMAPHVCRESAAPPTPLDKPTFAASRHFGKLRWRHHALLETGVHPFWGRHRTRLSPQETRNESPTRPIRASLIPCFQPTQRRKPATYEPRGGGRKAVHESDGRPPLHHLRRMIRRHVMERVGGGTESETLCCRTTHRHHPLFVPPPRSPVYWCDRHFREFDRPRSKHRSRFVRLGGAPPVVHRRLAEAASAGCKCSTGVSTSLTEK